MYGIYIITSNNKIVYVGIDKHIHEDRRLYQHLQWCNYNKQQINQFLIDTPEEQWEYFVLLENLGYEKARSLERAFINCLKPIFNFG